MKTVVLSLIVVTAIGLLGACAWAFSGAQSAACPGKITCPITGDEVCKDRCPLRDADRSDCPGKIECPIDGKLVCRDKCPLSAVDATQADRVKGCFQLSDE